MVIRGDGEYCWNVNKVIYENGNITKVIYFDGSQY